MTHEEYVALCPNDKRAVNRLMFDGAGGVNPTCPADLLALARAMSDANPPPDKWTDQLEDDDE